MKVDACGNTKIQKLKSNLRKLIKLVRFGIPKNKVLAFDELGYLTTRIKLDKNVEKFLKDRKKCKDNCELKIDLGDNKEVLQALDYSTYRVDNPEQTNVAEIISTRWKT